MTIPYPMFVKQVGTLYLLGLGENIALFSDSATGERGLAVKVTAGETISKGNILVYLIGGTSGKVTKCPTTGVSHSMPVGVALTGGNTDASIWMATNGLVQVLPETDITAAFGNILITSPDTSGLAGQYSTVPTSDHWDEVGHWAETGSGNGVLALASIHFN